MGGNWYDEKKLSKLKLNKRRIIVLVVLAIVILLMLIGIVNLFKSLFRTPISRILLYR